MTSDVTLQSAATSLNACMATRKICYTGGGVANPATPIASERLLFAQITRSYGAYQSWLWSQIGDAAVGRRQYLYGRESRNQYSKEFQSAGRQQNQPKDVSRTLCFERMDRLLAFGHTKAPGMVPRKICGDLANWSLLGWVNH